LSEILPVLRSALVFADDLIAQRLSPVSMVFEFNGGSEYARGHRHRARAGSMICALPSLLSTSLMRAFDEALSFLGRIVLGVLGQIAVRARFGDGGDDRRGDRPSSGAAVHCAGAPRRAG
jgi:hypothetical protein